MTGRRTRLPRPLGSDVLVWPVDDDGQPIHAPDGCAVCLLFSGPAPGETPSAWLARISGYPLAERRVS